MGRAAIKQPVRKIEVRGDVAIVPLTKGYLAVIDAADLHLVDKWNWSALVSKRRNAVYAVRGERVDGKNKMHLMHRVILGTPPRLHTDHIDGDGLNNRRGNLRTCTHAENCRNTGLRSDNKSGFKGVFFETRAQKWRAEIECNGKSKHLGLYGTKDEAAKAYETASQEMHGRFRRSQ